MKEGTYIEARNKTEMVNAFLSIPFVPGESARIVNIREDGTRTEFHIPMELKSDKSEEFFYKRMRHHASKIKRQAAHVWK